MLIFSIIVIFLIAAGFAGARLLRDVGRELTGLDGREDEKDLRQQIDQRRAGK